MLKINTETKKFIENILVSIFFVSTIVFFAPLELYFHNSTEFSFSSTELLLFTLIVATLSTGIIMLGLLYFKRIRASLLIALLTLGIFSWYQNIFGWTSGILNGVADEIEPTLLFIVTESTIMLTLFVITIKKRSFLLPYAGKIASVFIISQLVSVGLLIINMPSEPLFKSLVIDNENKFNFSAKEKNVVVLLLDSFQTDVFREIITERPEYQDMLKGFTYFPNNLGGYPTTYASVSLALTGNYYHNEMPIQEFIQQNFSTNSLPKAFKEAGYEVSMPLNMTLYSTPEITSSYKQKSWFINWESFLPLYQLSSFKLLPNSIKSILDNQDEITNEPDNQYKVTNAGTKTGGLFDDNIDFVNRFEYQASTTADKPTFKFYHLKGVHAPLNLNENFQYESMPFNRLSFKRQSVATLKVAQKLLKEIEKLGIYNNTAIVILGDHGNGLSPESFSERAEDNKFHYKIANDIKFAARPLLLIKDFNNQTPFSISDKPTTLGDIPKSLANIAKLPTIFPGIDILHEESPMNRIRDFFFYTWDGKWNKDYLPTMKQFTVSGNTFDNTSWTDTYKMYSEKEVTNSLSPIQLATPYSFNLATESTNAYLQGGWGQPEPKYTWTTDRYASVLIPGIDAPHNVIIDFKVVPFVLGEKKSSQRLNITINNTTIAQATLDKAETIQVTVPHALIENKQIKLVFELPDAVSPKEVGLNSDERLLGIALQEMTVNKVIPYKYGNVIEFIKGSEGLEYLKSGWSTPEDTQTWSSANEATIAIPIHPSSHDLLLSADIMPLIAAKQLPMQNIKVLINDHVSSTWQMQSNGEYFLTIPKEETHNGILLIRFLIPQARSPKSLGISEDMRTLGIAIKKIIIREKN
ncbi:MAG: sulfatase-like hydrolase/transferase [Candidatus Abawacabacteria bacterium]|nr:sulfatase-like hydrolase/transferase [Candidatus Abawacabacteria bacterium]